MANDTDQSVEDTPGTSLSKYFTTLIFATVISMIVLTIFSVIRTKYRRIYEPKTFLGKENQRVEPLSRPLFYWIFKLFQLPKEDLIRVLGLDAYFFIHYIYVHAVFFLIFFIFLSIILFPIYAVNGKGKHYNRTGLDLLTFGNILPSNSSRYAAPLVLAYIFISAYLYLLYSEMKIYVVKRQILLRNPVYQASSNARTILIMSIPKAYMSENVLFKMFNRLPGGVKSIWLNRNVDALQKLVEKRDKFIENFETIYCKYAKKSLEKGLNQVQRPTIKIDSKPIIYCCCRSSRKLDAIDYYKRTISQLNTEIDHGKTQIEECELSNSAFIQFRHPSAAHMAMQCLAGSIPFSMTTRYMNVKLENIIWPNVNLSPRTRNIRRLIAICISVLLILFWSIPVSFVGLVTNVDYLTNKLPSLRFIYNLPNALLGLITGVFPVVLLVIVMALPQVLLKLLAKFSGIPTFEGVERYVQRWFFAFQVIQVFLIVTISSSFASVVTQIINHPTLAATILAMNVPTASNFFLCFIALKTIVVDSFLILQVGQLVSFNLIGKLFDNTPRKIWKRYFTFNELHWGNTYPIFTNYVVITLVYSIIAPLILLVTGLAFIFSYVAYIYRLFYVSEFQYDTGGLSFPRAIHQSFTGVYLMEIMLAGLFFAAEDETGAQSAIPEGVLMIILLICTIIIHLTIGSAFDKLTEYLPIDSEEFSQLQTSSVKHIETICENTDREAYLHPCITARKPIVWFPNDRLGLTAGEIQRTQSSGLNIDISMEGAKFNEKNRIEISDLPPKHNESNEINDVLTRI